MLNIFAALWWMPYVLIGLAALCALAACKLFYRIILFRRDQQVAMKMAKRDPDFEMLVKLFDPKSLLPETLACTACAALLFGVAIYWARCTP